MGCSGQGLIGQARKIEETAAVNASLLLGEPYSLGDPNNYLVCLPKDVTPQPSAGSLDSQWY